MTTVIQDIGIISKKDFAKYSKYIWGMPYIFYKIHQTVDAIIVYTKNEQNLGKTKTLNAMISGKRTGHHSLFIQKIILVHLQINKDIKIQKISIY